MTLHAFNLIGDGKKINNVTVSLYPDEETVEMVEDNNAHFHMTGEGKLLDMGETLRRRLNKKGGMMHNLRVTAIPAT